MAVPAHSGHCIIHAVVEEDSGVRRVSVSLDWIGVAGSKGKESDRDQQKFDHFLIIIMICMNLDLNSKN
jgi:hypothetical protein